MKTHAFNIAFVAICLLTGCTGKSVNDSSANIWTFDVTKEYPKKEMYIQDIADVKYVPLESNDSMLWLGSEIAFLDEDYIIGANPRSGILVHDNEGKALHSFHRKGSGPGEYNWLSFTQYDKAQNEIYILSYSECKFYVYDIKGNFKRSFPTHCNTQNIMERFFLMGDEIIGYCRENTYLCLDKKSGSVLGKYSFGASANFGGSYYSDNMRVNNQVTTFVKDSNGYILTSYASDTTWLLTTEKILVPIGVRTPSALTMEEPIFLLPVKNTPRYYFTYTQKKAVGYPEVMYMVDKAENRIYSLESELKNKDCVGQKVSFYGMFITQANLQSNIAVQTMSASFLIDSYEDGRLSGRLKEIASNLKEDDNPVLMIIAFKE